MSGPAVLRNLWRRLTAMRTAIVLLLLLALAAVPGSLLPQRSLSQTVVDGYVAEHPDLAPVLDRLYLFDVFSSPWFAAVYLLLFVSLIACVVPRAVEHFRAVRAAPPPAPRFLRRLPGSSTVPTSLPTARALDVAEEELRVRRFRVVRRQRDGVPELSAEKGHLNEVGNLLFHLSLLALSWGWPAASCGATRAASWSPRGRGSATPSSSTTPTAAVRSSTVPTWRRSASISRASGRSTSRT